MSIDQFSSRQDWIDRQAVLAIDTYPQVWKKLVEDWQSSDGEDALFLSYAANYLLRTAGIHWALDPLSLTTRLGLTAHPDFQKDLSVLQLIVLSHIHSDHLDPKLLAAMNELPITWVIPEFIRDQVLSIISIRSTRLIIPQPGIPIIFGKLVLTPFNALHFNAKCQHGVPEMGYLAEFLGKRWLFPGDTRNYEVEKLPDFGKLDGVMAHCWLGRNAALFPEFDKLVGFSHFFGSMNTKQIVVSHFYEWARDARDLWTMRHFRLIKDQLRSDGFRGDVVPALTGSHISL